jgi:branched-chain amino acid transport system ATP-binding protein
VESVSKSYGGNRAVDEVSFELPAGAIQAVIGPNGAGKSTLFGLLAGQHRADTGRIVLGGRDITRLSARARARAGVSRAFQVAHVFTSRTVVENLRIALLCSRRRTHVFWAPAAREVGAGEVDELLHRFRLEERGDRLAGEISQGDRKKLEIAMGLASDPQLLLLDEPTAGMTPDETGAMVELIRQVQQVSGCSVLITEHDMDVVFGLAERIVVMAAGAVLAAGPPEEIRADERVKAVYLGGR